MKALLAFAIGLVMLASAAIVMGVAVAEEDVQIEDVLLVDEPVVVTDEGDGSLITPMPGTDDGSFTPIPDDVAPYPDGIISTPVDQVWTFDDIIPAIPTAIPDMFIDMNNIFSNVNNPMFAKFIVPTWPPKNPDWSKYFSDINVDVPDNNHIVCDSSTGACTLDNTIISTGPSLN